MKKLLTTACLFVVTTTAIVSFIAPTVFGQEQKTAKANPTPAESVTARVDKLFAQWDKPDSTGCALGIIKDGKLIYTRGYGMANLDYDIPLSSKSVFDIGSMVKQFVGMSILLLAKDGKLSLDDEIQKYLPEIPRYQSPVTIRHLIHHTSGIRTHYWLIELAGMASFDLTDDDVLGLIARQKGLNHKPGDEFIYTDTSYLLLGLIVQKVSGKSVHEFADENIFKPLGMTHTILEVDRTLPARNRATCHNCGGRGGGISRRGEMDTTIEDLFLWDQNFYNNKLGGGPALITEELSPGKLNNGESTNYAFGLNVNEYKGLKRIGHVGGSVSGGTVMLRFPEQNFSVICFCNRKDVNQSGLANQVADIFLADQFKKSAGSVDTTVPAISIPEKELASLTGTYFDPITSSSHSYYMKDGKLMIFNTALSPISQNRFKVVGGGPPGLEIVFVRPVAGGPMQVRHVIGAKTTTYYAVQSETLSSAQLAEFIGEYVSDELAGATYTLSIKDGKLVHLIRSGTTVLNGKGQVLAITGSRVRETPKEIVLTPAFADTFTTYDPDGDLFMLRFIRNQQNAVSGFTLSAPKARGLHFNRL
jgi:CubicO group peptidase (beta-lactamase class C family)